MSIFCFLTTDIEELTRKTGNFKQFAVFYNMLQSAITKSSASVTLDLLTYTDLELLRNKKLGSAGISPGKNTSQLQTKRYLILTYSAEFDRIHYPLALSYMGKPDPAALKETIRRLQQELTTNVKQVWNQEESAVGVNVSAGRSWWTKAVHLCSTQTGLRYFA